MMANKRSQLQHILDRRASHHLQRWGIAPYRCKRSAMYAKYKYESFGGSFVQDTFELIIGFAYISVFGMVSPAMVVTAAAVTMG